MHRPWQPFSETCRFGHVKYSFIGRAEKLVKRENGGGKTDDAGASHIALQHLAPMPPCPRDHVRPRDLSLSQAESLAEDFSHIMDAIGLKERDRTQFEHFHRKTRPPEAPVDRQMKLVHYYFEDDQHDLVELVRQRYREDIEFGGYDFPNNRTLTPWF